MKNKRLLRSFSFIDEKYVKEAEPGMTTSKVSLKKIIGSAACFVLVIALSLYMFIPINTSGPNVSDYSDSEYYPLIATIANYRYRPPSYKNNFQRITQALSNIKLGAMMSKDDAAMDMDGSSNMMGSAPDSNGKDYIETTDNQVQGVIESDLIKRTETHLFRLGVKNANTNISADKLTVYSIAKEDSEPVAEFDIPVFNDARRNNVMNAEMYLSSDGNTVTVVKKYYDENYASKIGILSIDVSNLEDIKVKKQISVDGSYNSSRMVDGKLLLVSEYYVTASNIDYGNPETYVPTITENGEKKCIKFKDIIYPEKLSNLRYSVVALMDEENLDLLAANALLSFNGSIYVSNENVYVTRGYTKSEKIADRENSFFNLRMTDIVVLKYADGTLENKGTLTVEGSVKDQYSMDEYEGHFRIVTSTFRTVTSTSSASDPDGSTSSITIGDKRESASLTVFNLESFSKVAEVKDFAPDGEEAASVRFDGDKAYVCTAVVVTFTDPVFFFDLSDYENITYTDTGVIDGFSSSLIQLGGGLLLGIGEENSQYNKVEIYEEIDGKVEIIDTYLFDGEYSTDYKSYYINRENKMFGLAVTYAYNQVTHDYCNYYLLLVFNGYEIVEAAKVEMPFAYDAPSRVRAILVDDYLYITDDSGLKVVSLADE